MGRYVSLPLTFSGQLTRCYLTAGLTDADGHLIKTPVKWTEKGLEVNGKYYQTPSDIAKAENLSVFTTFSDALKACKKGLVVTTSYKYGLAQPFDSLTDEQKEGVLNYVRNMQKQSSQLCIVHNVKYNGVYSVPVDTEKGHNMWSERERLDISDDMKGVLSAMQVDGTSQVAAIAAIKAQIADKASELIINAVKAGQSNAITATAGVFGLPEPKKGKR